MPYQVNDIVITNASQQFKVYAIKRPLPFKGEQYEVVQLDQLENGIEAGTTTHIYASMIAKKIGTITDRTGPSVTVYDHAAEEGKMHCKWMAKRDMVESNKPKWLFLSTLTPGAKIQVRRNSDRVETVTLERIILRGQRYHFTASTIRGATYKWPVKAIVLPAPELKPLVELPPVPKASEQQVADIIKLLQY